MQAAVYNQTGKESGTVTLPESVFGLPWNPDIVRQVALAMQANARTPVAHTKDRGEVRGGGRKPWRQKGTGRARHGSIRSPLWRGGGVTFGPRNGKKYTQKINKKMSAKALYTVLSQKLRDKEILFVDDIAFKEPKTKEARQAVVALSRIEGFEQFATKRENSAVIAFAEKNRTAEKSFNNFGSITTKEARNVNPVDLLQYKYLVLIRPEDTIKILRGRMGQK